MSVTRTVVASQGQTCTTERQTDNPTRIILCVRKALALVGIEPKVVILFGNDFIRTLAMNRPRARLP